MKQVLFFTVLFVITTTASYSQNSIPTSLSQKKLEKTRWDLDKYVWSHTHYKNKGNDKPALDFDAIDNWPSLGPSVTLSPDGKYFAYTIQKGTRHSSLRRPASLIIQGTENSWQKNFTDIKPGFFSFDSKQYIFLDEDTLHFLALGKDKLHVINGVGSYKTPGNRKNEWLAYQLKRERTTLVLHDLKTGKERQFNEDYSYGFDNSGIWLTLQSKSKDLLLYNLQTGKELRYPSVTAFLIGKNGKSLVTKANDGSLLFIDMVTSKTTELWKSHKEQILKEFKQDGTENQVVFSIEDEYKQISIWYWKQGMERAVMKANNNTEGIGDMLIQPSVAFTDNHKYIQFSLKPRHEQRKPMEDAVQLDIWSYKDTVIQSAQPYLLKDVKPFAAVINPENDLIIPLAYGFDYTIHGDFAVVKIKGTEVYGDRFWEDGYNKDSNWVVSLRDGKRQLLPTSTIGIMDFSPGGNYVVYFDPEKTCHYFSYNLKSGELKDISFNVSTEILSFSDRFLRSSQKSEGGGFILAWLEGDKGALLLDNYDIWQLDLEGKKPALNLTNGFGRANKIIFGPVNLRWTGTREMPVKKDNELVILTAFNTKNKYNGFYRIEVGKEKDPELLYMGPSFIQSPGGVPGLSDGIDGRQTIKASNANQWIIEKQSTTDAPNLFITKDFKSYKRLTNLQPQKAYNWMTGELLQFTQLDRTETQGVLYKPDNFDPSKKYPVIISFYTQLSDRLYQFLQPDYLISPNIFDFPAWLVSHGYLVFIPDIYFTQGQWGPSVLNTLDGAAKHLKTLPYVDSSHLGATGHSNSGRFGYYLLTHSHSFAAIASGAGTTNLISVALSIDNDEEKKSKLEWAEIGSIGSRGANQLWKNKQLWLDQTSVLHADNVTSPLLLFHNKNDGAFSAGQAVEMYIALRRLEKPVWWLQYNEGQHTLFQLRDLRDFTIRYLQYFDHYLKGAPEPNWMKVGLPYKLKGIESRYELNK